MSRETDAERKFVRDIKRDYNAHAIKFSDPSRKGAPDRLVILPKGQCVFIEFKLPGEPLREEQKAYHAYLAAWGHEVFTCTDAGKAYRIVESMVRP